MQSIIAGRRETPLKQKAPSDVSERRELASEEN
jgi:hypothetical protein